MPDKEFRIPISTPADLSGAKATSKEFDKVTKSVKGAGDAASDTAQSLGLSLKGLSIAGATAAGVAFLKQSIAASEEARQSQILLNQALANTGQYTEDASEKIGELAGKYQTLTNISDETWSDAASKLLQYKVQTEELPELFPILEGLAGRMGGDVVGASKLLGMALNGNTRGLRQFGVQVDEGATRVEILAAVSEAAAKGQGLLQAQTKSLTGALTGVKMAWGDLQEEVGKNVTSGGEIANTLGVVSGAIQFVTKHLDKFLIANRAIVAVTTLGSSEAIRFLGKQMGTTGKEAEELAKKSAVAKAKMEELGKAADDSGEGLENAAADAKTLADEMKRVADETKRAEESLAKVKDLERQIAEETESADEKTVRLQKEQAEASAAVDKSFRGTLRRPLDPNASAADMVREITNPVSGVNDPNERARMMQEVANLVGARKAVGSDATAREEARKKAAAGNQAEETPEARAARRAYEALSPEGKASALAGDAVAGRGGEGGYTGRLVAGIEKVRDGLKDGDQGGEMELLLKLVEELAARGANDAEQKKRVEARLQQIEQQMKASRS